MDFSRLWLDSKRGNVKPTTYEFYKNIMEMKLVPTFGQMELNKIQPIHIQDFINQLRNNTTLSPTSIHHYFKVLKIYFNEAVKMDLLVRNPCLSIEVPKTNKSSRSTYKADIIEKCIDYSRVHYPHMVLPIMLAAYEGLRRGEICGLKKVNLNKNTKIIRIVDNLVLVDGEILNSTPKSSLSQRSILLSDKTYDEICALSGQKEFILEMDGRAINPGYVTKTWKKITRALSLEEIHFHDLRHSHATLLLEAGIHPKIVSERLGHSVDMALNIYSHVTPNIQREAVNILNQVLSSK